MGYAIGGLVLGGLAENFSIVTAVISTGVITLIVAILFMIFYEEKQEKSVDLTS